METWGHMGEDLRGFLSLSLLIAPVCNLAIPSVSVQRRFRSAAGGGGRRVRSIGRHLRFRKRGGLGRPKFKQFGAQEVSARRDAAISKLDLIRLATYR
jgi:hypothetical protein